MSDIDELFETLTNLQRSKRLPPLHLWQPEHEGVIDIRIDREGAWYHEGVRIQRQPLVDLFATILRREGDDYFLVTPAEKMKIAVEEAPLLLVPDGDGGLWVVVVAMRGGWVTVCVVDLKEAGGGSVRLERCVV